MGLKIGKHLISAATFKLTSLIFSFNGLEWVSISGLSLGVSILE